MEIVLRSVVVFVLLWVLLRAMGKRELAEVTAFELVILVILGDIVQQGVTQEDMSVTGAALAVSTMGLLAVGTSVVGRRYRAVRPLLEGRPSIVVHDGRILDDVLRRQRIPRAELDEAARKRGLPDLADVAWGIVETDGTFSFVERSADTADQLDPQEGQH
ncbi:MAG TPA: YetF domain-containing protein [Acidimicrobiales bacterium]|nr:YetF domain-containing protein [Acidimicrobiales bacterium]